jgi:hypothetical protein
VEGSGRSTHASCQDKESVVNRIDQILEQRKDIPENIGSGTRTTEIQIG